MIPGARKYVICCHLGPKKGPDRVNISVGNPSSFRTSYMSRMNSGNGVLFGAGLVCLGLIASTFTGSAQNASPKPAAAAPVVKPATTAAKPAARATAPAPASLESHNAVVKQYCVTCHNERRKATVNGLSLEAFDITKAAQHADVAEKMILKLQAGMMPPPGARRPDAAG